MQRPQGIFKPDKAILAESEKPEWGGENKRGPSVI
jgi:hypothetical protein